MSKQEKPDLDTLSGLAVQSSFVGTIDPDRDYPYIAQGVELCQLDQKAISEFGGRIEIPHHHRWWEYGSALTLAMTAFPWLEKHRRDLSVLNVGAGWDILSPALAMQDVSVTEIEPDVICRQDRQKVNEFLKEHGAPQIDVKDGSVHSLTGQYDMVFCISVLEHVDNELGAWRSLAEHVAPGGMLFVTVDCVEDANKPYVFDHMRKTKYTPIMLKERVIMLTKYDGFVPIGGPDYTWHGAHVYDYTFFRAGFVKNKTK